MSNLGGLLSSVPSVPLRFWHCMNITNISFFNPSVVLPKSMSLTFAVCKDIKASPWLSPPLVFAKPHESIMKVGFVDFCIFWHVLALFMCCGSGLHRSKWFMVVPTSGTSMTQVPVWSYFSTACPPLHPQDCFGGLNKGWATTACFARVATGWFSAHPPGCRNPDLRSSPEPSEKKNTFSTRITCVTCRVVVLHVVSHGRRVIAGRRPQRPFAPFSCRPARVSLDNSLDKKTKP